MSIDEDRGPTEDRVRVVDTGVLRFSVDASGEASRVALSGELDLASSAELTAAFDELVAADKDILVEMGELTFIDSTGMAVLLRARRAAEQRGHSVTLRDPQHNVVKTLQLAGLDKMFGVRA